MVETSMFPPCRRGTNLADPYRDSDRYPPRNHPVITYFGALTASGSLLRGDVPTSRFRDGPLPAYPAADHFACWQVSELHHRDRLSGPLTVTSRTPAQGRPNDATARSIMITAASPSPTSKPSWWASSEPRLSRS